MPIFSGIRSGHRLVGAEGAGWFLALSSTLAAGIVTPLADHHHLDGGQHLLCPPGPVRGGEASGQRANCVVVAAANDAGRYAVGVAASGTAQPGSMVGRRPDFGERPIGHRATLP